MTVQTEDSAAGNVEPDVLADTYATAAKIKLFDEKYRAMVKSGQAGGMYYSPRGQEIIPSAVCRALSPDDYVLTIYRGVHDQIAKGVPLRELTAEYFGRATGTCKGKGGPMHITHPDSGLIVTTGVVGSGLPIGVGVALSAQMRGTGQVAVVNFGDGASNIGAFHESLNLASLWKLPVLFVCQNNLYAEYTGYAVGTSVDQIARRGDSYSMRSVRVDGNDAEEMYRAARAAVEAARSGEGPTLIEAMTYRFLGHNLGDAMEYMPAEELQMAVAADPVLRLRERLVADGLRSEAELAELEKGLAAEIEDAFEFALNSSMPGLSELTTDVYGNEAP
jgi:acetoin:2,6-dichlorophenolindophenol oxidoreductase subunit alpha